MGAHRARFVCVPPKTRTASKSRSIKSIVCLVYHLVVTTLLCESRSLEEAQRERDSLLKFKSWLENAETALGNWNNPPRMPCSPGRTPWSGVICYDGNVWGLQLQHMKLSGEINMEALLGLTQLRILSLMDNNFEGPLPEVRKLGGLKALYLSNNKLSGDIDDDAFVGMSSLKKVYLSDNQFSGEVPNSLASTPMLSELRIENNQFIGPIPNFAPTLIKFNVSNNQLYGPIPESLQGITDVSSFSGNKDLCGPPLDSKCEQQKGPDPNTTESAPVPVTDDDMMSILTIIVLIISILLAISAMAALFMVYQQHMDKQGFLSEENNNTTSKGGGGGGGLMACVTSHQQLMRSHSNKKSAPAAAPDGQGKLIFMRDEGGSFDLQDLLRASAEVLGSGSFGSSYKAVLMDGHAVVVKRFKQMNRCGREEFHQHMRRLGRLSHSNLLPLVAYYYRKEEKLLVFNFVHNGSLARQLHGNHTVENPGLNWATRLKVIKGVAKGMAYLYMEVPSLLVPHGNLKSSNVLLDKSMQPLLMDYSLIPMVNPEQAHNLMVTYKAPEYCKQGCINNKSDVWSLGVLILETITGKFPADCMASHELESWVESIRGETLEKVFDKDMGGSHNARGQMLCLLNIGFECCQVDVDKRPQLKEVINKIEQLDERDHV